ncbi:hypothetical protein BSKO_12038 [Bryopsis sp. KO-2023]|nr:hypothetical protein BSKO_12038 [Bryopsis sp. KO-2023]
MMIRFGRRINRHSAALARFSTADPASEHASGKNDSLGRILADTLEDIRTAGTQKVERVITTPQSPFVGVAGVENPLINLCSNNYLGLSNHPKLVEAAHKTLDSHGFGLSSVRFICGTQDIHKELESKISAFHGTEDTILYPSCFDANAGLFEAILTPEDAVISDSLNHASIIDGIRLCKARRLRYIHMNMESLELKLKETQDCRLRLIATDGVFSMDGHIAPLKEICNLAEKYDAVVFIDECHATGFLGKTGRGTDEHCGVQGKIDIINSTLGKALGGATGGYTTGRSDVIELLRQKSRPYLFSNSLAPPVVGASLAMFDLISSDTSLRDKLASNTYYFRKRAHLLGFDIGQGSHPIVPIMLGDAKLANEFADRLLQEGVYVVGFSYPVVPKESARVRVQMSASLERHDVDTALNAFEKVGDELGVRKEPFGNGGRVMRM